MLSSSHFHLPGDSFPAPLASGSSHPRSAALYQLTKQLLQKYHKEVRPVRDWTEATTVYLDISFRAVLDVVRSLYPLLALVPSCKTAAETGIQKEGDILKTNCIGS